MQINKGKNAEWHVDAGTFNIESGSIVVSDPCYEYDTWCAGDLPAVNGAYKARVGLYYDQFDVNRLLKHIQANREVIRSIENYTYETIHMIAKLFDLNNAPKEGCYNRVYELTDSKIDKTILEAQKNNALKLFNKEDSIDGFTYMDSYHSADEFVDEYFNILYNYIYFTDNKLDRDIRIGMFSEQSAIDRLYEYDDPERYKTIGKIKAHYVAENLNLLRSNLQADHLKRISYLHVTLNEFTGLDSDKWELSEIHVGVDSGQAGIYDHDWYKDYNGSSRRDLDEDEIEFEDEIDDDGNIVLTMNDNSEVLKGDPNKIYYEEICNLTETMRYDDEYNIIRCVGAGTFKNGAVSGTAWGDGVYNFYFIKDEDGKIVEGLIHYNEDYDEDEDDD